MRAARKAGPRLAAIVGESVSVSEFVWRVAEERIAGSVSEYKIYFNEARPHQGIGQRVPSGIRHQDLSKPIVIRPVLGGLHADYRRAA